MEAARIESIDGDTDWINALEDIDTVVHLAARVHVTNNHSIDSLAAYRYVNMAGTARLARMAVAARVKAEVRSQRSGVGGHPCEIKKKKAFHGVKRSEGVRLRANDGGRKS
jgi:nucleoside-diphosphate-sugar epimerase